MRVSDWIGDKACLIRIDPVHHKFAVFQGDRPGLCHMNFQVETLDDVMRSWHFLQEQGVEIEMGPGRHPQSTAVFLYFKGPEGFTYEYSWGVRRIEDDATWRPRDVRPPPSPTPSTCGAAAPRCPPPNSSWTGPSEPDMTSLAPTPSPGLRGRALATVVAVCSLSITFDGYDLVVYGATIPSLLKERGIGPAQAGAIGSYALIGMLLGALLVGTIADRIGRRRALIACLVWFSVFMGLCAVAPSPEVFGLLRFLCGIGLGGLMPTVAAIVIEYAPKGRGNFTYVLMQSGYAIGGILAASLAIPLIPTLGWQVMYLIGAAPLVLVVPLAWKYVPESLEYLMARGRHDEARTLATRLDLPAPAAPAAPLPAVPACGTCSPAATASPRSCSGSRPSARCCWSTG